MLINAGEKLHAMVGEMRDICFDDPRIGKHPFLDLLSIPTRRYAKEQVATQILAQVFSSKQKKEFTRGRHFDLQAFLKNHAELTEIDEGWIAEVSRTFNGLAKAFHGKGSFLSNRAIAVTTAIVAWRRELAGKPQELRAFADFVEAFVRRLRWQVGKGLDVDVEYRYLIDFQRHVTQASVERQALEARFEVMEREFDRWLTDGVLEGDRAYRTRTKEAPR